MWTKSIRLLAFLCGMATILAGNSSANAVTPMVSMGDTHGLALRADGTVVSWGSDLSGQLGVGRPLFSTVPLKVPGLTNVKAIAAGWYQSFAIRQDGTVWGWGENFRGQLGDGTNVGRSSPVQVQGLTNAIMVCASHDHTAALRQDGTVWAWGLNWYGQLGNGSTDSSSTPVQVVGLAGITSIACGDYSSTVALRQDGTVWAWGANGSGQLGDGTTTNRLVPVQVKGLSNVKAISGSTALKNDGTVWEWGGTNTDPILVPVQLPGINDVAYISRNNGQGYGGLLSAIKSDGVTWWQWQRPQLDMLGGSINWRWPSLQVPVGLLAGTAPGFDLTVLLKADGTVLASGVNGYGESGNGTTNNPSTMSPVVGLANIVEIGTGFGHSLALDANGNVWAWGNDSVGQLGRGAALSSTVPAVVPGLSNIVKVSAWGGTSLAVDQSGYVWAWGDNFHGQLGNGDGNGANLSSPVRLTAVQDVSTVSIGGSTSMALKRDGTVWAWGLGNSTGGFNPNPAPVPGLSNVISISANYQMLVAKQDGTVWSWGTNDSGELGIGTTTPSQVPVQVPGLSGVKLVAAAQGHSFALKTDGTVMAWGSGALGNGTWTTTGQLTPIPVPGLTSVVDISTTYYTTLARRTDGSVWGMGACLGKRTGYQCSRFIHCH